MIIGWGQWAPVAARHPGNETSDDLLGPSGYERMTYPDAHPISHEP